MAYTEGDLQVVVLRDAIRRRPEMYLGSTGRVGIRLLTRDLLEVPLNPTRLLVQLNEASLEI